MKVRAEQIESSRTRISVRTRMNVRYERSIRVVISSIEVALDAKQKLLYYSNFVLHFGMFKTMMATMNELLLVQSEGKTALRSPNWFSKYGFHLCAFPERECRRVLWFNGSPIRMTAATEKTFWPTLMPKGLTLQMVPFNLDHVLASLPVQELMNRRRSGAATATRGGDDVRVEYDARLDHPEAVPFRGSGPAAPTPDMEMAHDTRHGRV
ncbi:unnamed protein product [Heligmosomoides polygyrus]|uniref:CRAL-TRIO domain-containing protein n=1 Tax=Heligmosomoides polygyrus TaxID=6339 RepID=A0A183GFU0_HELPZ|nr:unnamed protein product [Heligmosomoides polygyrus]